MRDDGKKTSTSTIRLTAPFRLTSLEVLEAGPFKSRIVSRAAAINLAKQSRSAFVYYVCCDGEYFKLFAGALASSIERNSGIEATLYVHVINPSTDVLDLAQKIEKEFEFPVVITEEYVDLDHLSRDGRRTYYSCARFLHLPKLLETYQSPILVADIDQIVIQSLCEFARTSLQSDVSLIYFPFQGCNFLSLFSASVIFLNNNRRAVEFAEFVRRYIFDRMREGALLWHLDQAALAVAYLRLPETRYNLMSPQIMHSELHQEGTEYIFDRSTLFWSITYSLKENQAKLETHPFTALLAGMKSARGETSP